ncbi:DUF4336 domain-containing protein [Roseofilum reptotaenium CS-1145]|nr:DUF4336 domain-containing protein [Roseofilum reptotaenium CS-1145]
MSNVQPPLSDLSWPFWPLLPLYPYGQRRTLRQEVVQDTIWTFDQLQGILYVVVPIRMTIIKLSSGGLLVYAPVAPTPECVRLVNELVDLHGDVKYIILPTVSGLEHKIFVGPFARHFPQAQVFIAPHQWSFPFNLPVTWLGLPGNRTHILPTDSRQAPFSAEFDYHILGPINLGPGQFEEVALLHRATGTVCVTDTIISLSEQPPAIAQFDPYPLLFHAKDSASDPIQDTPENRRKGWQRICLFALYFQPSVLETPKWSTVFKKVISAPDRSKKAYFGLFPFNWKANWKQAFQPLKNRLWVAPVLQTLILNRAPQEVLNWSEKVARWDFQRLIPCHFSAPIRATGYDFRQAFCFLKQHPLSPYSLPPEDLKLLQTIDLNLSQRRIVPPAQQKV